VNKAQNQNKQINHSVLSGTAGKSSEILSVAEGRLILIVQEAAPRKSGPFFFFFLPKRDKIQQKQGKKIKN